MRIITLLKFAALSAALVVPEVASAHQHRSAHSHASETQSQNRVTARHYTRAARQVALAERELLNLRVALEAWDAPGIERLVSSGLDDVERARAALAVDRLDVAYERTLSAESSAARASSRIERKHTQLETLRRRTVATVSDASARTGRRTSLTVRGLVDEAARLCARGEVAYERGNYARAERRFEASLAHVEDARLTQEAELRALRAHRQAAHLARTERRRGPNHIAPHGRHQARERRGGRG